MTTLVAHLNAAGSPVLCAPHRVPTTYPVQSAFYLTGCYSGQGLRYTLWFYPDPSRRDNPVRLLDSLKQRQAFDTIKALAVCEAQSWEGRAQRDASALALVGEGKV